MLLPNIKPAFKKSLAIDGPKEDVARSACKRRAGAACKRAWRAAPAVQDPGELHRRGPCLDREFLLGTRLGGAAPHAVPRGHL